MSLGVVNDGRAVRFIKEEILMAEEPGKSFLRQVFEAAVDQGKEFLQRGSEARIEDAVLNGNFKKALQIAQNKKVNFNSNFSIEGSFLISAIVYGEKYVEGNEHKARDYYKLLEYAIDNGANMNTTGYNGKTILMLAAEDGDTGLINLMLNKGYSNIQAKDGAGLTVFDYIGRQKQTPEILDVLERLRRLAKAKNGQDASGPKND